MNICTKCKHCKIYTFDGMDHFRCKRNPTIDLISGNKMYDTCQEVRLEREDCPYYEKRIPLWKQLLKHFIVMKKRHTRTFIYKENGHSMTMEYVAVVSENGIKTRVFPKGPKAIEYCRIIDKSGEWKEFWDRVQQHADSRFLKEIENES